MISLDVSMKSWRSSVVEQLICNQQVGGSNPFASSFNLMHDSGYTIQDKNYYVGNLVSCIMNLASWFGEVAEWTKAADCKSAGASLRRFESCPPHQSRFRMQDARCKMHQKSYHSNHVSCIILWVCGSSSVG
jgi:hypothetical protein